MPSKPAMRSFLSLIVLVPSFSSSLAFKEKKLVLYMHDILSGKNATAVVVAGQKGLSSTAFDFGAVIVLDDRVTKGPNPSSKTIARAKGLYANTDLKGTDVEVIFSVVFENEKYNGSTLEIHGSDRFHLKKREWSVVGGTGVFRYARGYAIVENINIQGFNYVVKLSVNVRLD